jgi:rubredoxin
MNEPLEFTCPDCSTPVTRWGRFNPYGEEPLRCLVCYWIYENPSMSEEDKKTIREWDGQKDGPERHVGGLSQSGPLSTHPEEETRGGDLYGGPSS